MSVVCATDLDRTLIYSSAAAEHGSDDAALVVVERYRDADASFMTGAAASTLAALGAGSVLVPVTTRTVEQLMRVRLPGRPSRWAVAANGGVLLEDGVPDASWSAHIERSMRHAAPVEELQRHVRDVCRSEWTRRVRVADDLFCYAVLERETLPADFVAEQQAHAAERGWTVSLQGRKLYWVPGALTKSAAVAEVVRRSDAAHVLAAGDSLLDADLLDAADEGVLARHGELAASGWQAAHVHLTEQRGVAAGEEIVSWFATRLRARGLLTS